MKKRDGATSLSSLQYYPNLLCRSQKPFPTTSPTPEENVDKSFLTLPPQPENSIFFFHRLGQETPGPSFTPQGSPSRTAIFSTSSRGLTGATAARESGHIESASIATAKQLSHISRRPTMTQSSISRRDDRRTGKYLIYHPLENIMIASHKNAVLHASP